MKAGIVGASGYVGGELLRLLLSHPKIEVTRITSQRFEGEYVQRVHPNLRGTTSLKFTNPDKAKLIEDCDFLFLTTPQKASAAISPYLMETGMKVVDASPDYRLKNPEDYQVWYNWKHPNPELLQKTVYGLPELHREEIRRAKFVTCPGCMAAAALLALAPIVKVRGIEKDRIVVDTKVGSSGAGAKPSLATHHAEHFSVVRPYKPVGHRHTAEVEQELKILCGDKIMVSMSTHAVNMVRGIMATCHTFLEKQLTTIEIWRIYREFYQGEPFIRFVRDKKGVFRYPDPKIVVGSNYCDIGFETDERTNRLVLMAAIDNLMKGAAGTAVQNMNIMLGFDEKTGLNSSGLHPV